MAKQVSDLTVQELRHLIENTIRQELESLLVDPDHGLELREEINERLKASLLSKKRYSFAEVKRKLKHT
jgi:signal recognition particle GTPase